MGGRQGRSLTFLSESDPPFAPRRSQRKLSILTGIRMPPSTLFYFRGRALGPGKDAKEALGNAVQRQLCRRRGGKKTARGFPFSLRLLPHFVFLFGNKWNCKVSRCFATVAQSHSLPPATTHTPFTICKNRAAPNLPARATVFPQVTLALKLLLCRKLKNHLASLLKQCVFLLCFQKALGDSMFVFSLLAPRSPM